MYIKNWNENPKMRFYFIEIFIEFTIYCNFHNLALSKLQKNKTCVQLDHSFFLFFLQPILTSTDVHFSFAVNTFEAPCYTWFDGSEERDQTSVFVLVCWWASFLFSRVVLRNLFSFSLFMKASISWQGKRIFIFFLFCWE